MRAQALFRRPGVRHAGVTIAALASTVAAIFLGHISTVAVADAAFMPSALVAPPSSRIGVRADVVGGGGSPPSLASRPAAARYSSLRPDPPRVRYPEMVQLASSYRPPEDADGPVGKAIEAATSSPPRSVAFSTVMALSGATLGPFLDSYHSVFGVLKYDDPIHMTLWGDTSNPALVTSWWVPPLFGLAGFLIGWLYVGLDAALRTAPGGDNKGGDPTDPTPPKVLIGIALFTFQYWLSGALYANGIDRASILAIMSTLCGVGFFVLDATAAGLITSAATAIGGPLIEVGLISALRSGHGYHYSDPGETGFFPLWIAPVYFLGGPAVGNLARAIWNALGRSADAGGGVKDDDTATRPGCQACDDTRATPCPNCDSEGYYVTYGRSVRCNACKGRGLVICRSCFSWYGDDPSDIGRVREIMSKMPD